MFEKDEVVFARILTRLNNFDSELADIKNWKDPKNTAAKLETVLNSIEDMQRTIGHLTTRIVKLETATVVMRSPIIIDETATYDESTTISDNLTKKRGRPRKEVI